MVKELERAGLPTVHICTIVPISKTVGANRIVPAVAIPHPLGNPELSKEDEKALRRKILEKALIKGAAHLWENRPFLLMCACDKKRRKVIFLSTSKEKTLQGREFVR